MIKVRGSGLHPAAFADSNQLRIGDIAMAIGNPLGLQSSFTQGIVSALDRNEPEGNGVVLPAAIQTSAAINPGNSGGALVDIHGAVIGIPTLARGQNPQLRPGAAAGIGFAIPSDTVKNIADQIAKTGTVTNSDRAFLGVSIADTGLENGVYITKVLAGTAAAKSGLTAGERITSVNGTATPSSQQLGAVVAGLKPGQTAKVGFTRQSGATGSVELTLGQYPGTAT